MVPSPEQIKAGEARVPKHKNRGAMTSVLEALLDSLAREESASDDFCARSGVAFCVGLLGTLLRNGAKP